MRFFKNFKIKLLISILIAFFASLYQLETSDDFQIVDKKVMLSKNRADVFEFLTQLEQYPSVISFLG